MDALLQWELDWVDRNADRYDSPLHAQAVKGNITKRYEINKLRAEIEELQETVEEQDVMLLNCMY